MRSGPDELVIPSAGVIHQPFIGTNNTIGAYTEIGEHNVFEHVTFGDFSYTGQRCIVQNAEIGKFSNIAAAVRIGPTDHPMDRPTQHHFTYRRRMFGFAEEDDRAFFAHRSSRRTEIGHDTWLGHGVIVLPERSVGTGAVIGAGSVVTRDVPPYAVAVGNPARVVRYRFDEPTIAALLEIAWWDWEYETIKERLDDFAGDTATFIETYREGGDHE